jgi:hypothetical protein
MSVPATAGVTEQLTALMIRDEATSVEAACEWVPAAEFTPSGTPSPAHWLIHLRHPDDPTTYTARAHNDLQAVRCVVAELLPLAADLDQARLRQAEAEARLVRAVQATRDGAP